METAKDKAAVFYLLALIKFVDSESKFDPAGFCGTVIRNSIVEFRSQFRCFCVATSKRYRMSLEVTRASKDNHSPYELMKLRKIPPQQLLLFFFAFYLRKPLETFHTIPASFLFGTIIPVIKHTAELLSFRQA